ncbi:MAG: hypothetical protein ABIG61_07895 [Planctomycetota bacterium]
MDEKRLRAFIKGLLVWVGGHILLLTGVAFPWSVEGLEYSLSCYFPESVVKTLFVWTEDLTDGDFRFFIIWHVISTILAIFVAYVWIKSISKFKKSWVKTVTGVYVFLLSLTIIVGFPLLLWFTFAIGFGMSH